MRGLDAGERRVLRAICRGRKAWRRRDRLEARYGAEAVAALVRARPSYVAEWDRPDRPRRLTLSPWGAERLGKWLRDRWQVATVEEEQERDVRRPDGKTRSILVRVRVRRPAEVAHWEDRPADEAYYRPDYRDPVQLPRWGEEITAAQWVWAALPDTRPGADPVEAAIAREEAVIDPASGKPAVRGEDGQPLRLFAGPGGLGGVPVLLDRRLARPAG